MGKLVGGGGEVYKERKRRPELTDSIFLAETRKAEMGVMDNFVSSKTILTMQVRSLIELLRLEGRHEHKLWVA